MGNNSAWHIKPQGTPLHRAMINAINFLADVVYESIVKPNTSKLETNIQDTDTLKNDSVETFEQLLDTQFELENAKDDISYNLETQLDLEFRVSQLEDSMEV